MTAVQKTVPAGLGETGPQPAAGQFTITVGPDAKPGMIKLSLTIVILNFDQWKNEEAPRA